MRARHDHDSQLHASDHRDGDTLSLSVSLSLSLAGLAPRRLTETPFTADSNGIRRKSRTDKHEIRTVRGNVCKSSARAGKGTWYNCKSSAGAGKGKGYKCKDAPKAGTGYSEEVCRRFTQKRVGSSVSGAKSTAFGSVPLPPPRRRAVGRTMNRTNFHGDEERHQYISDVLISQLFPSTPAFGRCHQWNKWCPREKSNWPGALDAFAECQNENLARLRNREVPRQAKWYWSKHHR